MTGRYIAIGACFLCGRRFEFDAERVPSVPIDPVTRKPPDVGGTDPARAIRQPLCADCVEKVNVKRRAAGHSEIPVLPGAYDGSEVLT